jgi:hypothetical protein
VLKVIPARWVYVIVLALLTGALLAVYVGFPRHPPTRGVPTVGVVGQDPSAMAVDEPMARVYVANKLADHESRPVAAGRSEWLLEWQRPVQLLPFGSHPSSGPIPGSFSVVSVAR